MAKIELNHWFVNDDQLSIAFLRYYAIIDICEKDSLIYYQLRLIKNCKDSLVFNFYSLEDAMGFTEEIIKKGITTDEIIKYYQEQFENNEFKKIDKQEFTVKKYKRKIMR